MYLAEILWGPWGWGTKEQISGDVSETWHQELCTHLCRLLAACMGLGPVSEHVPALHMQSRFKMYHSANSVILYIAVVECTQCFVLTGLPHRCMHDSVLILTLVKLFLLQHSVKRCRSCLPSSSFEVIPLWV